jgi:hypothetical protein
MNAILRSSSGQALLEFAICFPLMLAAAAGTLLLFRTEWNRARCAHEAFLSAHQALRSEAGSVQSARNFLKGTQIEKTDLGVIARAVCGSAMEEVQLPDLEHAQW